MIYVSSNLTKVLNLKSSLGHAKTSKLLGRIVFHLAPQD